jgi:hypothetical protein
MIYLRLFPENVIFITVMGIMCHISHLCTYINNHFDRIMFCIIRIRGRDEKKHTVKQLTLLSAIRYVDT